MVLQPATLFKRVLQGFDVLLRRKETILKGFTHAVMVAQDRTSVKGQGGYSAPSAFKGTPIHPRLGKTGDEWAAFVKECFRLTKLGGIICLTETGARTVLASPCQVRFNRLLNRAFWHAGMSFSEDDSSVSPLLKQFARNAGYRVLKEVPYLLNLSYGTEFYQPWLEGARTTLQLIKPFILEHFPAATDELDSIIEGVLQEMALEQYREHWFITSVIGQKPE